MPRQKNQAPESNIAVAYARYSSAGQRDVSIDQQLNDIRAYAEREGYTIVHEYADRAKSGYKNVSARLEFQRMMSAAESGAFGTVIAWKVDRFGRNRRDSAIYKGQLRDHGVNVVYAMEPIPEGAAGVLTEGMLESIAEWYSRNLSENVQRGMRDNALKGISNGVEILGYRRGPDGHYVIDADRAPIVRRIFEKYISGYSAGSISRMLNESGIRTARGAQYTTTAIMRIIANECYTGVYLWDDIRIPDGMPVIISREDWERAQRMRKKTGKHFETSPADFLLTGKAFCGQCGKAMVGDSGRSKNGVVHYYYTCSGHKAKSGTPRTCDKKSIRKDDLENAVLNFIKERCLTCPEMEKIADAILAAQAEYGKSSPRAAMIAELKETEKKISNINDAIENGIWNSSTSIRLKSLEDTASALRSSIAEIDFSRNQLLDRDRILFFLTRMAKYDLNNQDRKKQLIATFINSVFVYDHTLKVVINAVEGQATLKHSELPSCSDEGSSGLPRVTHPNRWVAIYTLAV